MNDLRTAAQQALEAMLNFPDDISDAMFESITALKAALAQEQAEPVPGAWVASPDGRVIYDDVSADDGLLRVSGDFENDEQRIRYVQRIVDKLNAAPPQRKPLTEGEISAMAQKTWKPSVYYDAFSLLGTDNLVALVRAVEKASWEKNNGQA